MARTIQEAKDFLMKSYLQDRAFETYQAASVRYGRMLLERHKSKLGLCPPPDEGEIRKQEILVESLRVPAGLCPSKYE